MSHVTPNACHASCCVLLRERKQARAEQPLDGRVLTTEGHVVRGPRAAALSFEAIFAGGGAHGGIKSDGVGMGRLRDTELQLAKAQEALTDTRHELSKSKAAGKEWRKQQRLAALDLDNYRSYIKTAREKEKHFKAEMAQANKRQVALALELAKKDDSAIELKRRIDELSKVAEETFQQQQAMQHQVSSPVPPASLLMPRSSCPAPRPSRTLSPGICVAQLENAGDGR